MVKNLTKSYNPTVTTFLVQLYIMMQLISCQDFSKLMPFYITGNKCLIICPNLFYQATAFDESIQTKDISECVCCYPEGRTQRSPLVSFVSGTNCVNWRNVWSFATLHGCHLVCCPYCSVLSLTLYQNTLYRVLSELLCRRWAANLIGPDEDSSYSYLWYTFNPKYTFV